MSASASTESCCLCLMAGYTSLAPACGATYDMRDESDPGRKAVCDTCSFDHWHRARTRSDVAAGLIADPGLHAKIHCDLRDLAAATDNRGGLDEEVVTRYTQELSDTEPYPHDPVWKQGLGKLQELVRYLEDSRLCSAILHSAKPCENVLGRRQPESRMIKNAQSGQPTDGTGSGNVEGCAAAARSTTTD